MAWDLEIVLSVDVLIRAGFGGEQTFLVGGPQPLSESGLKLVGSSSLRRAVRSHSGLRGVDKETFRGNTGS